MLILHLRHRSSRTPSLSLYISHGLETPEAHPLEGQQHEPQSDHRKRQECPDEYAPAYGRLRGHAQDPLQRLDNRDLDSAAYARELKGQTYASKE